MSVKDRTPDARIMEAIRWAQRTSLDLMFRYYDRCVLFFCCSAGSSIKRGLNLQMAENVKQTAAYLHSIARRDTDLHGVEMILSEQFHYYRYVLEKGFSREKAVSCGILWGAAGGLCFPGPQKPVLHPEQLPGGSLCLGKHGAFRRADPPEGPGGILRLSSGIPYGQGFLFRFSSLLYFNPITILLCGSINGEFIPQAGMMIQPWASLVLIVVVVVCTLVGRFFGKKVVQKHPLKAETKQ